jgi:hypothetical protein
MLERIFDGASNKVYRCVHNKVTLKEPNLMSFYRKALRLQKEPIVPHPLDMHFIVGSLTNCQVTARVSRYPNDTIQIIEKKLDPRAVVANLF